MFQMAKFLQVTFDGLLLTGCLLHVFQNYADKAWWWLLDDNMRMITTMMITTVMITAMMITTMVITTMMITTALPGGLRRGGGRDGSSFPAIAQRVCWGERHRGGKRLDSSRRLRWLLSFRNVCVHTSDVKLFKHSLSRSVLPSCIFQDAIYFLGEALRRGVIDCEVSFSWLKIDLKASFTLKCTTWSSNPLAPNALQVFLKHVRQLSRRQFILRLAKEYLP